MRKPFILVLSLVTFQVHAQLTVEHIMRDQKWIGTSPANINWSWDSKTVLFNWNPDKNIADSTYAYSLGTKAINKANYNEAALTMAITNGVSNKLRTQLVYAYRGDIFLIDLKTGRKSRITQTEEIESTPRFAVADEWIVYNRNQNLYAWNSNNGLTQQLTNFTRGGESAASTATAGRAGNAGGRTPVTTTQATTAAGINQQEQWLVQNQLQTSDVLKLRKLEREKRDSFLRAARETDTLKVISIGEKTVQQPQVSPDGRFVTYRLSQAAPPAKNTIVPDYVTESGFTTDIPGRTKVGTAFGRSEFFVYDRQRDSVLAVSTDSIPGTADAPDYVKDYPQKQANRRTLPRQVAVNNVIWNEKGSRAIVDIRSTDNKDRWIMELDAIAGKLKPVDRQRDEAWIGGPGISGFTAKIGWIHDSTCYFQSEASGYSRLYTYNLAAGVKKQLTSGNYEVQDLVFSKGKEYFYLLTNEEHPGKQG